MTSNSKSRKSNSKTPSSQTSLSPSSNGAPSTPQIKSARQHRQSAERASSATSNRRSKIDSEDEKVPYLASEKFPTLIGDGALIGIVRGVDEQSKKFEIFISESDFTFYKLLPGTLVSVSVASDEKKGLPLCSLAKECARRFGFGSDHEFADTAGSYFVIAILSCSSKVGKGQAILSSKLSYMMGSPVVGRKVFIFPTQYMSTGTPINGRYEEHGTNIRHLKICECSEMYLELVHSNDIMRSSLDEPSTSTASIETSGTKRSNEISLSPKTPSSNTWVISNSTVSDKSSLNLFDASVAHDLLESVPKECLQTWIMSWLRSRVLLHGNFVEIQLLNKTFLFRLVKASGESLDIIAFNDVPEYHASHAFKVDAKTQVHLQYPSATLSESLDDRNTLFPGHNDIFDEDSENVETGTKLGGLSKEYGILKNVIVSSSVEATVSSLGLRTTKGILLHGPPGTGKTSLVQHCAKDAGVKLFTVCGPEIVSQYYGESEKALRDIFDAASRALPAVVFIDELDAIAPARDFGGDSLSERIVATLLNLMDGITTKNSGLCIVAATNRLETIEPALRRSGRFGREIEIGVPSPAQRADILHHLLEGIDNSLTDSEVWQLATNTHGYVGADLASLCNEAALVCLKRSFNFSKLSLEDNKSELDDTTELSNFARLSLDDSECSSNLKDQGSSQAHVNSTKRITMNGGYHCQEDVLDGNGTSTEKESMLKVALVDFEKARIKVRPSAMREVILEVPKVSWKDVGGQEEVKTQLMEAVLWPQKHQDAFIRIGTQPPSGILLFGPPGCSKTLLARAVASEAGLNFLAVKGPELFSKWVGESEKAVKSLFAKARANSPAIIFFDEIDGLAVIRGKENDGVSVSDRVMSQLLVELDGLHERVNVTVIAATNRPDKIDSALLRPGRFDRLLYVGPPNEIDREAIFHIHLRKTPVTTDVNIKELAALTEGYTGADISLVCREAGLAALEENIDASCISMSQFKAAINQVTPLENQSYQNLSARFQRLVESSRR